MSGNQVKELTIAEKAIEATKASLRTAFTLFASDELTTLTTLLERARQGFSVSADGLDRRDGGRDSKSRRAM